jgi:hypothetical protein
LFYKGNDIIDERLLILNNTETSIDVSEIDISGAILIINPIDELKAKSLTSVGDSYYVSFIPTATCKVYEGETELDLNDIFVSHDTPVGPTHYRPDGSIVHIIACYYSPREGKVRELYETGANGFGLTIE